MCWWARKQRYAWENLGAVFHTVSKTFRYARGYWQEHREPESPDYPINWLTDGLMIFLMGWSQRRKERKGAKQRNRHYDHISVWWNEKGAKVCKVWSLLYIIIIYAKCILLHPFQKRKNPFQKMKKPVQSPLRSYICLMEWNVWWNEKGEKSMQSMIIIIYYNK